MHRIALLVAAVLVTGCSAQVSPEVLRAWQSTPRYTCCNMHYEHPAGMTDANYFVGTLLPAGTPVTIEEVRARSLTFRADGTAFTIEQAYGTDQESGDQYFRKLFVETDPRARIASYPAAVQQAITDGRVEVGMTREQVLLSLGYPPTHRTPSLDMSTWIYWYNRWFTYQVQFDGAGLVTAVVGIRAPTRGEPVAAVAQPPRAPSPPPRRY